MNPSGFVWVGSVVGCAACHHGPTKGVISPAPLEQPCGNGKAALVLQLLEIENFVELEMLIISIMSSGGANLLPCPHELLLSWAPSPLALTDWKNKQIF